MNFPHLQAIVCRKSIPGSDRQYLARFPAGMWKAPIFARLFHFYSSSANKEAKGMEDRGSRLMRCGRPLVGHHLVEWVGHRSQEDDAPMHCHQIMMAASNCVQQTLVQAQRLAMRQYLVGCVRK